MLTETQKDQRLSQTCGDAGLVEIDDRTYPEVGEGSTRSQRGQHLPCVIGSLARHIRDLLDLVEFKVIVRPVEAPANPVSLESRERVLHHTTRVLRSQESRYDLRVPVGRYDRTWIRRVAKERCVWVLYEDDFRDARCDFRKVRSEHPGYHHNVSRVNRERGWFAQVDWGCWRLALAAESGQSNGSLETQANHGPNVGAWTRR